MEKKIHIAVTIVALAFGLIYATMGSAGLGHAQTNTTSAAKSAGSAMNKTAGNMTSAGGAAANKTGNATSSNPLSKVPILGKLFGGK